MTIVEEIKSANLCIGCGYCASLVSGSMVLDDAGFLVPSDDSTTLSPEEEALVKTSCPGIRGDSVFTQTDVEPGARFDQMWGRYFFASVGHSTDRDIRHLGSSGGALTGISNWLVESGQVDGVLVTGYDPDYPIGTRSRITADLAEIRQGAGSKYCPAAPLAGLSDVRRGEGQYAVVGRPCDIATLRRAINAGDPIGKNIKFLLSFFCAGTPSDTGNLHLLTRLGVEKSEDVVQLRHRGNGWPGDTVAELGDGTVKTCTYNESWGGVLRKHTHSLCKICADGIGEQADIVAADAWYGDDEGYPVFSEADGRSLIIARTTVGRDLLRHAIGAGILAVDDLDVRAIDQMQPGQLARRRQLGVRISAYRLMGHRVPKYRRAALKQYSRGQSLVRKIVMFSATIRRLLRARR